MSSAMQWQLGMILAKSDKAICSVLYRGDVPMLWMQKRHTQSDAWPSTTRSLRIRHGVLVQLVQDSKGHQWSSLRLARRRTPEWLGSSGSLLKGQEVHNAIRAG